MDLEQTFYILGIITSILFIIFLIVLIVGIFMIYKKVKQMQMAAKDKVNGIVDMVSGKMDFLPFGATLFSLVLPFLKKKMKKN